MSSKITALSYFSPEKLATNKMIEGLLQKSNPHIHIPENIIEITTGIQNRHFCQDNEYNSTLASKAALKLFEEYAIYPKEIDLLIFASAGQDLIEPATAHIIQDTLKTNCRVFDIKNACNAFMEALLIADSFIKTGLHKKILIVTGEASSKSIKWNLADRDDFKKSFPGYTLGDLGTAVLVEESTDASGLIASKCLNDSSQWKLGVLPAGGSRHPRGDEYTYFQGNGAALKDVFEKSAPLFLNLFLKENNLSKNEIKYFCIHQVSAHYTDSMRALLNINDNQIIYTIKDYGNVAAATIPLQLCLLKQSCKIQKGDKIILIGLAGGTSIELVSIVW